jgi:hypothetical protein
VEQAARCEALVAVVSPPLLPLAIRSPRADDRSAILDAWQKSYLGLARSRPRGFGPLSQMDAGDYYRGQEQVIDGILRGPETRVLVAHDPGDVEFILGWVCAEPPRVLHFVYTSANYRRERVASRLMSEMFGEKFRVAGIEVSHWTRVLPCYYATWGLKYNPYVLHSRRP